MMRDDDRQNELTRMLTAKVLGFSALSSEAFAALLGIEGDEAGMHIALACRYGWLEEVGDDLFTVTDYGVRPSGGDPAMWSGCTVSSNAEHLSAIARAVAAVRRHYRCRVMGERAMRAYEVARGGPLASARMGGPSFSKWLPRLHRADFTAWRRDGKCVAVEVERTRKSWKILLGILQAWVLATHVEYVVYVVPREATQVRRDIERGLSELGPVAQRKIIVVWLEDLESGVPDLDAVFGKESNRKRR